MLLDEIFLYGSFSLHHLTFIFKVVLGALKVINYKQARMTYLSGLILLILYGHGGAIFTSFFLSTNYSLITNDLQLSLNIIIWTLFWHYRFISKFLTNALEWKIVFLLVHSGNEIRRALSLMDTVKSGLKIQLNFFFPFLNAGISLTAGGILWNFWCFIIFQEQNRCQDLYDMNWKNQMVFYCAILYQIFYKTTFELYISYFICILYLFAQLKEIFSLKN